MTRTIEFIPFSSGTEYLDWMAYNCDCCTKGGDPSESGSSECEIFEAIADAAGDDGVVDDQIAHRLGGDDFDSDVRCPEFVPTPENLETALKEAGYATLPGLE